VVWPRLFGWFAVTVCTLGLAWLLVAGQFYKLLIDSTVVIGPGGRRLGRLRCHARMRAAPARLARWSVLSVVTLGAGLVFYSVAVAREALDATVVEWD